MNTPGSSPYEKSISGIHNWYSNRRRMLFRAAMGLMSVLAASRLGYQFWRLLLDQSSKGAIDLRIPYHWVSLWFAGEPLDKTILLPATYAMLWPLLGWLSLESARWLWALLYIISLAWLLYLVINETGIRNREEKLFALLFITAIYPTGITIGNGQVILFLLPAILTAVLLEERKEESPGKDFVVSLLLLFSLLKIPVSAPFLLIPLIRQKAVRPLLIAACGYIALTFFSISFRDAGLMLTLQEWLRDSSALAVRGGHSNLHMWLGYLGLKSLILPLSFISLTALGLWLYVFRKTDIWIQLGVAAIVARLWTYHRLYDDLLILIPLIAIFRIVRSRKLTGTRGIVADFLMLISFLALLSPGFLLQLPYPLGTLFRTGHVAVWISLLTFLLYYAYREREYKAS